MREEWLWKEMTRNDKGAKDVSDFLRMYQKQLSDKIGSIAYQTSKERKFNRKKILQATDDIMCLQKFQNEKIIKKTEKLSTEMNRSCNVCFKQGTNIQLQKG
jgi:hypothetical protein